MSLKGKTMFISGASRGIGLAIAKRAAQDGANIALIAKTAEPHPKLPGTVYTAAKELEEAGGQALPIVGDVRDPDSVEASWRATFDAWQKDNPAKKDVPHSGVIAAFENLTRVALAPGAASGGDEKQLKVLQYIRLVTATVNDPIVAAQNAVITRNLIVTAP